VHTLELSGHRGAEGFLQIVEIEGVQIDDLRTFWKPDAEDLAALDLEGFAAARRHDQFFLESHWPLSLSPREAVPSRAALAGIRQAVRGWAQTAAISRARTTSGKYMRRVSNDASCRCLIFPRSATSSDGMTTW
jgi:hypothetical protein